MDEVEEKGREAGADSLVVAGFPITTTYGGEDDDDDDDNDDDEEDEDEDVVADTATAVVEWDGGTIAGSRATSELPAVSDSTIPINVTII